jgi:hypothetical protein
MEVTGCSEMVVPIYKATRCHIPDSCNIYSHHKLIYAIVDLRLSKQWLQSILSYGI